MQEADELIERLCKKQGLKRRIRSTLKSYAGSTHWHYGRENLSGTLDITLWPKGSRLWISVHENRAAFWTEKGARDLARGMEIELAKHNSKVRT